MIRGYNSSQKTSKVRIDSLFKITEATQTNLLEEPITKLGIEQNNVSVSVTGKRIFSVKIALDRMNYQPSDEIDVMFEYDRRKAHFDDYEYAPYVTEDEIQSEIERAEKLKEKADHPMWRRTALEAQLSAILARNRYHEKEIKKLGYGLNEARVQRRVYDYIKMFKDPDNG